MLSKGQADHIRFKEFEPDLCLKQLNTEIYDEIIRVENEDAFGLWKSDRTEEGILVGIITQVLHYMRRFRWQNVRKIKERQLCSIFAR